MDFRRVTNNEIYFFIIVFIGIMVYFTFILDIIIQIDSQFVFPIFLLVFVGFSFQFILKMDIIKNLRMFAIIFLLFFMMSLVDLPIMISKEGLNGTLDRGQRLSAEHFIYDQLPVDWNHEMKWYVTYPIMVFVLLVFARLISPNRKTFNKAISEVGKPI